MEKNKKSLKATFLKLLNTFEIYLGVLLFIAITILLFVQVISRYCLGHSVAWTEELAQVMFVWMLYFGIAAAVRKRKFLRIEFLLDRVSPNLKRAMLILSNLIQGAFNIIMIGPVCSIISGMGDAKTSLLRIPKSLAYAIIPLMLILTTIRIVQEIWVLMHEHAEKIGFSEPLIDINAIEQEYLAEQALKAQKPQN